jgi:flagellar biosynthesis protein FliQ
VAFCLVGLLLVVALAARGGHPGSDGHVTTRSVPASLQNSLVTLLAIVYVLMIVGVIVLFFRRRKSWQEPLESHWLKNFAKVMVLMLVATLFGYWVATHTHFHRHQISKPQVVVGAPQQPAGGARIATGAVRPAKFEWPVAAGLAAIVVLGTVATDLVRRRESSRPEDEEAFEAQLARVVEVTIDALRREPDPRRAVVAAYASMERVLGSHGLPRSPAEAPLEYLGRILRDLDVRESAVATLTRLFEYARFSPHEIGPELKDDALAALAAVRADLLAPESAAA